MIANTVTGIHSLMLLEQSNYITLERRFVNQDAYKSKIICIKYRYFNEATL